MPRADDWARASEMNAHLKWPSAEDGDAGGSEESAPTARGFFLGQLPDDEPAEVWTDESPDVADGADLDGLAASFETELHDPVAIDGDATELSLALVTDEPSQVVTGPMQAVGARKAYRAARKQRGKARLSRVALVAGVVAALAAGTAVYVGTRAKADDHHASRPTSTSFERRSPSTTATTVAGSDPALGTEPAPDPASVPGASAPASPQGTSSAPAGGPGSAVPTAPRAPGSTAAPPNTAAPPSAPPPRSPTCQLLAVVCP